MVSGSQNICAEVKELVGNLRRHTKTAGGIFCVDHHQIHVVGRADVAEVLTHNAASRAPENVPNEKNVQKMQLLAAGF
jgi:hypothetical protein